MNAKSTYWKESIQSALEEVGVMPELTDEQWEMVALTIQCSAENIGQAFQVPMHEKHSEVVRLERIIQQIERDQKAQEEKRLRAAAFAMGNCEWWELYVGEDGNVRKKSQGL